MPPGSSIELNPDNVEDFIFVTASDNRYFHPAMDTIGNVQRLFPNRIIIFYDLEENKSQADIAKVRPQPRCLFDLKHWKKGKQ